MDRLDEFGNAVEAASANPLVGQVAKPSLSEPKLLHVL